MLISVKRLDIGIAALCEFRRQDCGKTMVGGYTYYCSGKDDRKDCNNYRGVTLLSVLGKAFPRIILDRVRHHLLEHQHPEQSDFIPKRKMIDCILALQVLNERRREFQQGLLLQPMLITVKRLIQ